MRFSLRTIFVVVGIAAFASAFFLHRISRLNQIAADVQSLGEITESEIDRSRKPILARFSSGFYGFPTEVRKYSYSDELKSPEDLIDIISRNATISVVVIEGSPLNDSHVDRLLSLPLKHLAVMECSVGDALSVEASESLVGLTFRRTRLNDPSLLQLGDLPNVRRLNLTRTRVSDASIDYLAGLPSLTELIIRRCKISENGKLRLEGLRPDVSIEWEPLQINAR